MKLQQNKSILSSSSTVKSSQQISYKSILQNYKNKITQVKSIDEEEPLQGKFETNQLATEEQKKSAKPNNTGLPDNLKSGIENMSGYSMDDVKVHYNSSQPATLQAHAYAQGTDIHIAPGQEKHLPHEAWHVVQQKQGRVKPTMQMKGSLPVNDDAGLEKEADVMGARAIQFKDNRADVLIQRKLQNRVKNNHQVSQLRTLQGMVDKYFIEEVQPLQMKKKKSILSSSLIINNTNSSPVQLAKRRKNKVSAKAEENRERLLEKQNRKYAKYLKQIQVEQAFHEMIGTDAIDQHKFPFDNFNKQGESISDAMDRLPIGMRNSENLRSIVMLPDAAHGQHNEREIIKKGEFQEALAGWYFAKERGLSNVKSMSAQIDFEATDKEQRQIPFDPFMSPLSGEGGLVKEKDIEKWAADKTGSYYKHTHNKGGNPNTVGVWDQTYSSNDQVSKLKARLQSTKADKGANIHELKVPIASAIASEHIAAEIQIDENKSKMEQWKEVEKRYNKAQRKKPKDKRMTFAEALIDDSALGRYWCTQI